MSRQVIHLFEAQAPDPDAHRANLHVPYPAHHTSVVVLRSLVLVPHVAVSIQLHHGKLGMEPMVGSYRAERDGVLPSDGDHELPHVQILSGRGFHRLHHPLGRVLISRDRRRSVNPEGEGLNGQLFVVKLETAGGRDERRGPAGGSLAVGGGPVIGDRQNHRPGRLEFGVGRADAEKILRVDLHLGAHPGWVGKPGRGERFRESEPQRRRRWSRCRSCPPRLSG